MIQAVNNVNYVNESASRSCTFINGHLCFQNNVHEHRSVLRTPRRFCGAGPLARGRPPGRPGLTWKEPSLFRWCRGSGADERVRPTFGCGYAALRLSRIVLKISVRTSLPRKDMPEHGSFIAFHRE